MAMNDFPLDPLLEGLLPDSLEQKYRILGHMKFDGKNYTTDPDDSNLVSTMSGQTHSAYLAYDKVRSECISLLCGVRGAAVCMVLYTTLESRGTLTLSD